MADLNNRLFFVLVFLTVDEENYTTHYLAVITIISKFMVKVLPSYVLFLIYYSNH